MERNNISFVQAQWDLLVDALEKREQERLKAMFEDGKQPLMPVYPSLEELEEAQMQARQEADFLEKEKARRYAEAYGAAQSNQLDFSQSPYMPAIGSGGIGSGSTQPIVGPSVPILGISPVREFSTGATRDQDLDKLDFEGFLDPDVLAGYAKFMHKHRKQSDGTMRAADNWQLGIPSSSFKSSLIRHVWAAWRLWRGHPVEMERVGGVLQPTTLEDSLYGILFNTMGLLRNLRQESQTKVA